MIKKEKYKNFHLTFFYIMTYAIIILRMMFFGTTVEFILYQLDKHDDEDVYPLVNIIDSIATYAELILGFQ